MDYITLNDGNKIPAVGFGVFRVDCGRPTFDAALKALELGYRHIDTATAYYNEADVGAAVRASGLPRDEVWVTSKLWIQDYGYEQAKWGIDRSLAKLGLDYVDLYLLHQPYGDVVGAWKALEEAKEAGKIRSIGVSNMNVNLWNQFVPQFDTLPSVNQVQTHAYSQQRAIRELIEPQGVRIEAWQPLGSGNPEMLSDPVIVGIAEKYGKNAGQVCLRFLVQQGIIILPKSVTPSRIAGNIELFDFELTADEMDAIRALDGRAPEHNPEAPGLGEMLMNNYPVHD